jgi:hypothetical protein
MTTFTKFHIVVLSPSHSLKITSTSKTNKDFSLGDGVIVLISVISSETRNPCPERNEGY